MTLGDLVAPHVERGSGGLAFGESAIADSDDLLSWFGFDQELGGGTGDVVTVIDELGGD